METVKAMTGMTLNLIVQLATIILRLIASLAGNHHGDDREESRPNQ